MDSDKFIKNCETTIGYTFQDASLLITALTHTSGADEPLNSNERMEFLGDSVLGHVICDYLFHRYPTMLEGDMTKIKSAVVSRTTCQSLAKQVGLNDFIILGKGLTQASRLPSSILANLMESVIAAIYLDGGLEAARKFILRVYREELDKMNENRDGDNFKSVLQNTVQKRLGIAPDYKVLEETGPQHRRSFRVAVRIAESLYPAAWGATKKEAEQRAAENALAVLHNETPPYL